MDKDKWREYSRKRRALYDKFFGIREGKGLEGFIAKLKKLDKEYGQESIWS